MRRAVQMVGMKGVEGKPLHSPHGARDALSGAGRDTGNCGGGSRRPALCRRRADRARGQGYQPPHSRGRRADGYGECRCAGAAPAPAPAARGPGRPGARPAAPHGRHQRHARQLLRRRPLRYDRRRDRARPATRARGCRHPRHRRGVDPARLRPRGPRGGVPARAAGHRRARQAQPRAPLGRHAQGRGDAARGRRRRAHHQRCLGADARSPQPEYGRGARSAGGLDARAGRSAHHAGQADLR